MATSSETRQVSVNLPTELVTQLDAWAKERQLSRSALLVDLIDAERELAQAYHQAGVEGFYDDIEVYVHAQAEVVLAEPCEFETW